MSQYPLNPNPFGLLFADYADDRPSGTAQPSVLHAHHFAPWRDDQGTPHVSDTSVDVILMDPFALGPLIGSIRQHKRHEPKTSVFPNTVRCRRALM